MMSKNWLFFAVVTMLSGSAIAAEQDARVVTPNLDKGTKVLEGAGAIDMMADELQLQIAYGQFVADGFELGLVAAIRDNDFYMSTELGVRAEYNFVGDSALVPFVGTSLLWANAELDDSNLDADAGVFSVGGGVKYFIRDDVALAFNANYLLASEDIFLDSEDGELQDDEISFLFSVRFYFD